MENYQFIGRNIDITDAMRNYATDKLDKLSRFFDHIVDSKVVMAYHQHKANPARVEVQLNVPQGIVRAEEEGVDTYGAIDKVVDKLERQLKRFKGRYTNRRNDTMPPLLPDVVIPESPEKTLESTGPEIVRLKRHILRPMSPEDAAVQMDALGHDFYMFRNIENDLVSVIYLREDGDYGLIEPA
ncbi:MAG: ribosome-associated translation inhibitor RaiA [Deinococcales bacterium]